MKKLLLLLAISLLFLSNTKAQTYGWVDISGNIPGSTSLSDIFVIGDEVWITCSSTTELYYNDAGGTTTFTVYTTPDEFSSIHMLTSDIGYAGALSYEVYRTADGGQTWTLLFPLTGTPVTDITFPPSGEPGYCCGSVGKIYKVDSTGLTQMTSGTISNMNSITFPVSSEEGWVCGESIIRHYVGGLWTAGQWYPSGTYRAIHFIDNQNGWAVGSTGSAEGQIIHTNNGTHWSTQTDPAPSSGVLNGLFFLNNGLNGWAVGNFGRVLSTTNGGTNWVVENTGATSLLTGIYFTSTTSGYITGAYGQAFKYTEIIGITPLSGKLPKDYSLFQIYPNPFNPKTTIEFDIPRAEFTRLIIYDALGREVTALVSEELKAGRYKADWPAPMGDATDYSSGVYYYQLKAGDYSETRKCLLIR